MRTNFGAGLPIVERVRCFDYGKGLFNSPLLLNGLVHSLRRHVPTYSLLHDHYTLILPLFLRMNNELQRPPPTQWTSALGNK